MVSTYSHCSIADTTSINIALWYRSFSFSFSVINHRCCDIPRWRNSRYESRRPHYQDIQILHRSEKDLTISKHIYHNRHVEFNDIRWVHTTNSYVTHKSRKTNPYIGQQIRIFKGHPRTPWTVKYHSKDSNIVASGCLGYEVRTCQLFVILIIVFVSSLF